MDKNKFFIFAVNIFWIKHLCTTIAGSEYFLNRQPIHKVFTIKNISGR